MKIAGVTQLVECNLAKVDVAGSNPVSRSCTKAQSLREAAPFFFAPTGPCSRGTFRSRVTSSNKVASESHCSSSCLSFFALALAIVSIVLVEQPVYAISTTVSCRVGLSLNALLPIPTYVYSDTATKHVDTSQTYFSVAIGINTSLTPLTEVLLPPHLSAGLGFRISSCTHLVAEYEFDVFTNFTNGALSSKPRGRTDGRVSGGEILARYYIAPALYIMTGPGWHDFTIRPIANDDPPSLISGDVTSQMPVVLFGIGYGDTHPFYFEARACWGLGTMSAASTYLGHPRFFTFKVGFQHGFGGDED